MHISEEGLALIKESESFKSKLYNCPAGHCTIGYGHLVHRGPTATGNPGITDAVYAAMRIPLTREKALKLEAPFKDGITEFQGSVLLQQDIAPNEATIKHLVKVMLDQSEFDALLDFEYNLGAGSLENSNLLKLLNAGKYDEAAAEFDKWVYANHHKLSGLATRRDKEEALFKRDLPRVPIQE